jgi:hypothetical protein
MVAVAAAAATLAAFAAASVAVVVVAAAAAGVSPFWAPRRHCFHFASSPLSRPLSRLGPHMCRPDTLVLASPDTLLHTLCRSVQVLQT